MLSLLTGRLGVGKKACFLMKSMGNNDNNNIIINARSFAELAEKKLNETKPVSSENNTTKPSPKATSTTSNNNKSKTTKKKDFIPVNPFDAVATIKANATKTKREFTESIELAINMSLDPKKQDQQLRVNADLPHGTGKATKVCVFTTKPELVEAANAAGADIVGGGELVEKILSGNQPLNFHKAIASTEINLSKVAKLLGPKGLMPNKKLNTVTDDVARAVERAKAGNVELRVDRNGALHTMIGNISMPDSHLLNNLKAIVLCIEANRPAGSKGKKLMKSMFMKSTMGASVKLDLEVLDPKKTNFFTKPSAPAAATASSNNNT